eukprot:2650859-Rhodomonas_salina.1
MAQRLGVGFDVLVHDGDLGLSDVVAHGKSEVSSAEELSRKQKGLVEVVDHSCCDANRKSGSVKSLGKAVRLLSRVCVMGDRCGKELCRASLFLGLEDLQGVFFP